MLLHQIICGPEYNFMSVVDPSRTNTWSRAPHESNRAKIRSPHQRRRYLAGDDRRRQDLSRTTTMRTAIAEHLISVEVAMDHECIRSQTPFHFLGRFSLAASTRQHHSGGTLVRSLPVSCRRRAALPSCCYRAILPGSL